MRTGATPADGGLDRAQDVVVPGEITPEMPTAGGGSRGADQDALDGLRHGWGDAYEIGFDDERGLYARRLDGLGGDITADDPDALWTAIREDYDVKPVPRVPCDPPDSTVG